MPIYDYKCINCGHEFIIFVHSYRDPAPECKICHHDTEKQISTGTKIDMHGIVTAREGAKREKWTKGAKIV